MLRYAHVACFVALRAEDLDSEDIVAFCFCPAFCRAQLGIVLAYGTVDAGYFAQNFQ